jgi:hypothetical protein
MSRPPGTLYSRRDAALRGTRPTRNLAPRVIWPYGSRIFNPKNKEQHGVKALDGGDADAALGVYVVARSRCNCDQSRSLECATQGLFAPNSLSHARMFSGERK